MPATVFFSSRELNSYIRSQYLLDLCVTYYFHALGLLSIHRKNVINVIQSQKLSNKVICHCLHGCRANQPLMEAELEASELGYSGSFTNKFGSGMW